MGPRSTRTITTVVISDDFSLIVSTNQTTGFSHYSPNLTHHRFSVPAMTWRP